MGNRRHFVLGLVAAVLILPCGPARAADLAGKWQVDATVWEASFSAMVGQMMQTVPEDQREEMRIAMESELEQLRDPDGARSVTFESDGSVTAEGIDADVIPDGTTWTVVGSTMKLAGDDPSTFSFEGPVGQNVIDLRPALDPATRDEMPWSQALHLVLRRVR